MSISTPGSGGGEASSKQARWRAALGHLGLALKLLDESDAPPEIGAEIDLAMHRLQGAIDSARDAPP